MVYRLNACCWCGTLKQGSIIIAALFIAFSIFGILFVTSHTDEAYYSEETDQLYVVEISFSKTVQVIAIIMYGGAIVFSAIMVIGVVKDNPKLILPWLIMDGVGIVLQLTYILVLSFRVNFGYTLGGLICTWSAAYYWYVPFSHYLNLKDEYANPDYS